MNKILKIALAVLGAVNVVFSLFIPIAVALIIVKLYPIQGYGEIILLLGGSLASVFRAIDIGFMK